jgi:hypothetical protein
VPAACVAMKDRPDGNEPNPQSACSDLQPHAIAIIFAILIQELHPMKTLFALIAVVGLIATAPAPAQKLLSKNGHIWFYSHTPMEDIEAHNNEVASYIDTHTGDVVFQLLMKSFKFKRALMEEHFNENYMQSDKFPKSDFKAKITNLGDIDFAKKGSYKAMVEGALTIHGKTRTIKEQGTIEVNADNTLRIKTTFSVVPQDYDIDIPATVRDKFAKSMTVNVDATYEPYKK